MGIHDRAYYRDTGGGSHLGGLQSHSMVTWLLGINCVVFLIDGILGGSQRGGALAPSNWGNYNIEQAVYGFQFWRLVTYQFLHGGLLHLLFNMIALYFFGPMLERWWGSRRFIAFYLLCGMSGAVVFTLMAELAPGIIFNEGRLAEAGFTPQTISLVGASGAIFGIFFGAAKINPDQTVMLIIPPIPMKLKTLIYFLTAMMFLSLIAGSSNAGGEAAHLGGAVLGYLLVRHPTWLNFAERISFHSIAEKQQTFVADRRVQRQAAFNEEIERILTKVHEQGLQSLTRREKKLLSDATDKQRNL